MVLGEGIVGEDTLLRTQCRKKVFRRNSGLSKYPGQGAHLHFFVIRDDATDNAPPQDDMTATLPDLHESQSLKCADDSGTGHMRKLRHGTAPRMT